MKVACTVRSGGKQRKPHSRQRPCGTNNIWHREMLDDIYILQDAKGIIGDGVTHGLPRPHNARSRMKILSVAASRVIRRIVTYHYTVPMVVWMVVAKEIATNHLCG